MYVLRVTFFLTHTGKYYAAQIGIEKSAGGAEAQSFLMQLMDELERVRAYNKTNNSLRTACVNTMQ